MNKILHIIYDGDFFRVNCSKNGNSYEKHFDDLGFVKFDGFDAFENGKVVSKEDFYRLILKKISKKHSVSKIN
jgi:hypothetical protein